MSLLVPHLTAGRLVQNGTISKFTTFNNILYSYSFGFVMNVPNWGLEEMSLVNVLSHYFNCMDLREFSVPQFQCHMPTFHSTIHFHFFSDSSYTGSNNNSLRWNQLWKSESKNKKSFISWSYMTQALLSILWQASWTMLPTALRENTWNVLVSISVQAGHNQTDSMRLLAHTRKVLWLLRKHRQNKKDCSTYWDSYILVTRMNLARQTKLWQAEENNNYFWQAHWCMKSVC
jgi:hypothetical protein